MTTPPQPPARIDWSLNTPTLALIHGIPKTQIALMRKHHAPQEHGGRVLGRPAGTSFDFSKVADWSKTDSEIALEVGCSKGTVYLYRKAKKIEKPARKPGSGRRPKYKWAKLDLTKTIKENAKLVGGASIAATWEQMQKAIAKAKEEG